MNRPVSQSIIRARADVASSLEFLRAARWAALRGAESRVWEAQCQLTEAKRRLELVVRREQEQAVSVAVDAAFDKTDPNPWL